MVILKTQRLILKPIKKEDIKILFQLTREKNMQKFTNIAQNKTKKELEQQINKETEKQKEGKLLRFTISNNNTNKKQNNRNDNQNGSIGMISLKNINKQKQKANISYFLGEQYRGNGYMHEACIAIINYAYTKLKLNRIELSCSTKNKASKKVIESLNAKFEGIARQKEFLNNQFHDLRIYSILKKEWQNQKQ